MTATPWDTLSSQETTVREKTAAFSSEVVPNDTARGEWHFCCQVVAFDKNRIEVDSHELVKVESISRLDEAAIWSSHEDSE